MPTSMYRNSDNYARSWTSIRTPEGTSLHLEPGETAEIDVTAQDEDVQKAIPDDPYLQPVAATKKPADTPAASKE